MSDLCFPKNFLWGSATAAFQVEGYHDADGAGVSNWLDFSRQAGRIDRGDSAEVGCDQYHLYAQDCHLMQEFGFKAYRFSLSWSRICPDAGKKINPKGVDYYNRLIDSLLECGIEPWVTVFHWDLPKTLEDAGGWRNRETALRLGEFAQTAAELFSDRVKNFFTLNEIYSFCRNGYQDGAFAPGLKLKGKAMEQVVFNGCLGHGYAMQGLRAGARQPIRAGIAENVRPVSPIYASDENIAAARKAFHALNGDIFTLIADGRYPQWYIDQMGDDLPELTPEDAAVISTPMDIVGYNLYNGIYAEADTNSKYGFKFIMPEAEHPFIGLDWLKFTPESLYWGPRFMHELWPQYPIYITENGCPGRDDVNLEGKVEDTTRVMFYRSYLTQLQRACADGVPVKGYFPWSFMDNFEWARGYTPRFGLFRVDYHTRKRLPKRSACYIRECIRQNAVV